MKKELFGEERNKLRMKLLNEVALPLRELVFGDNPITKEEWVKLEIASKLIDEVKAALQYPLIKSNKDNLIVKNWD